VSYANNRGKFLKRIFGIAKNGALLVASILFTIVLMEIAFRILLGIGWVKTVTETYSGEPYGFFLWSREGGHPHGVSNRFTYIDHDYDPAKLEEKRIVVIGDSFVEALQVDIDQKMGPLLQASLNDEAQSKYSVLSFGRSGDSPAYYLERYKSLTSIFKPEATFVLIYLGNDFRNASQKIENRASGLTADRYISYLVDPLTKEVKLDPRSTSLVDDFREGDKSNFKNRASYQVSTRQKINNFFLMHFLLYSEVPYRFAQLKKKLGPATEANASQAKVDDCDAETIFLKSHAACWSESVAVMQYIMHAFRQYQETNNSKVYFIGIPANETFWGDAAIKQIVNSHGGVIPVENYDHHLAKKYSTTTADVDFEQPNKMLKKIMVDEGLSYIDLHDRFYKELTENKRQVYCRWVDGHLCEEGHQIVAEEMKHIVNDAKRP
jgi:hypothetical protein